MNASVRGAGGTLVDAPPPRGGKIGPNALLQLSDVLLATGGPALRDAVFQAGGVTDLPAASGMIPEAPVAAVHQAMRRGWPEDAPRWGPRWATAPRARSLPTASPKRCKLC